MGAVFFIQAGKRSIKMELKNPYLHSKVMVPAAVLAALVIYLTMGLSMGPLFMGEKTSESFFPVLLGIIGIPIAIKLLVDAVKEVKTETVEKAPEKVKIVTTPLILSLVSFLYIVLFHFAGLIPAVLIYVFLFLVFFDDKVQQLPRKFLYALLITGVVYLLYWVIFKVQFEKMFFGLY